MAVALMLTGCSDNPDVSNENRGRLAGGLGGAVIANQVSDDDMAPVVGALIGSYVGGEAGRQKDQQNQKSAANLLNSTLAKSNSTWTDQNDGTQYTMWVSQPYQKDGKTCRPYTLKKTQNGAASSKNGIACLTPDQKVWNLA